jgi:GT2 family glycosyltransferase
LPRLTVIIVNYNSGERLARCLDHLARQTFADFKVVVVDNGSSDDSVDRARTTGVPAAFDLAGENLGFAAANNRAAKVAAGEWLVFLNPDAYAEPDWLQQLVAASERYPQADAFGSTQLDAADPATIDGAGDVFHIAGVGYRACHGWPVERLPPEGECFAPCAAAAMYRRRTFEALGGFDERFFCYGEDVDLGFRLRLSGGRAVQVRDARVLHEGSAITGRRSEFTVYHGHRNRIWLTAKNLPAPIYWATAPLRFLFDLALFPRFAAAGLAGAYGRALRDGYGRLGEFSEDRRRIARTRAIPASAVAALAAWSPIALASRGPKAFTGRTRKE